MSKLHPSLFLQKHPYSPTRLFSIGVPTQFCSAFKGLPSIVMAGVIALLLWGCTPIRAETRTFLPLELEFLDQTTIPAHGRDRPDIGGLSGIAYDPNTGQYLAVSDDKQSPQVVTLNLGFDPRQPNPKLGEIEITATQPISGPPQEGNPLRLDLEGIALTPDTLYLSSEGLADLSPPLIAGYQRQTGSWQKTLPIPNHYLSTADADQQGILNNLAFESLTLSPEGDRLFTATEAPLAQDVPPLPAESDPETATPLYSRFLHYWIGPGETLVAEHLYPLEPPPEGMLVNGLSDLLALDNGGHFLALERAYNPLRGYRVRLFQLATGGATDTSQFPKLVPPLSGVNPILKQPALDFTELGIPVENLEGMTLGPPLVDGGRSLILISDNNLKADVPTQLILLRLRQGA
jgi:hypothetical protein